MATTDAFPPHPSGQDQPVGDAQDVGTGEPAGEDELEGPQSGYTADVAQDTATDLGDDRLREPDPDDPTRPTV